MLFIISIFFTMTAHVYRYNLNNKNTTFYDERVLAWRNNFSYFSASPISQSCIALLFGGRNYGVTYIGPQECKIWYVFCQLPFILQTYFIIEGLSGLLRGKSHISKNNVVKYNVNILLKLCFEHFFICTPFNFISNTISAMYIKYFGRNGLLNKRGV